MLKLWHNRRAITPVLSNVLLLVIAVAGMSNQICGCLSFPLPVCVPGYPYSVGAAGWPGGRADRDGLAGQRLMRLPFDRLGIVEVAVAMGPVFQAHCNIPDAVAHLVVALCDPAALRPCDPTPLQRSAPATLRLCAPVHLRQAASSQARMTYMAYSK